MSSHNRESSRDRELVLSRHQTVPMYVSIHAPLDLSIFVHIHASDEEANFQIFETKVGQF